MTEQAQLSTNHFEHRLEFETVFSDLSSRFINLPPWKVDREIEDALRRVCETLGIDVAVLWQWSGTDPDVIRPTHFCYAQEGLQPPEPMLQEHYPWAVQQMLAGRVVAFSSPEELPAEAAVDLEHLRLLGIKSNLTLPLSVGDERPVGALGLNALRVRRDWPDAVVNRLQLVGQVFTNALARKRADETLRESQERVSLAVDSAGAGLWTLDYSAGTFWATERARAIFGYLPDEVISMERFEASVHPDDWGLVRGAIERSGRTGEPVDVEYRVIHPGDGREKWFASSGRCRFKSTGEPDRLMGISIDITERRRTEEALRTSEARLAAGADLVGLAFYEVDFDARVAYIDDQFREVCGVPLERDGLQVLEFWMEHLHPDDRQRVLDERVRLHDGRVDRLSIEYRYLHPAHGQKWIQHAARVAKRDATGRTVKSYGVLRDITERKRVEEELRDLSWRLIRAQEEERALLARELHDDVTQRLAVLAIDVGRAELATPDGAQAETMRAVREGLARLSEDIHSLAYLLHPAVLEELGLAEALRAECERRRRQSRVVLSVEIDPLPAVVGKDQALCLFRVAQEALNNVARHAGAREASVNLRQMDGGLRLAVRDDGVGFDPAIPGKGRRLGLASMRERVRLVNGTLDIESAPGRGTAIVAWIPAEGEVL